MRGPYGRHAPDILRRGFNPVPMGFIHLDPPKHLLGLIRDTDYRLPSYERVRKQPTTMWKHFQSIRMTFGQLGGLIVHHAEAELIAVPTGKLSGLTVVDVDGDGEDLDFALHICGEPEVMVETPTGSVHLYFQYSGENCIQGWKDRPIDIQGEGGLICVPGSERDGEPYRFIAGDWDALANVQPVPYPDELQAHQAASQARGGGSIRDRALFDHARNVARGYLPPDLTRNGNYPDALTMAKRSLTDYLIEWNWGCADSDLSEGEVRGHADRYWQMLLDGRLFPDRQQTIRLPISKQTTGLMKDDPVAWAIYSQLVQKFGRGREFSFAQKNARRLGCSPNTFRNRMDKLMKLGLIERVYVGGRYGPGPKARGDPHRYVIPV